MLRRLGPVAGVLLGLIALAIVGTVATVEFGCRGQASVPARANGADAQQPLKIDVPGYRRNESATYFTFPEWYIVYVAEDLANFVQQRNESQFGYFSSIVGFWHSFCTIKQQARGRADPASDVTVMIYTIGLSFSAEYAIKGLYETTIGRLTEWLRGSRLTEEDRFAHAVALDYAKFLYAIPWYKYPFSERLIGLWKETPGAGTAPVRKWERRFALSLEYAVKAGYGWLIQKALDVANDNEAREIMLVVQGLTDDDVASEPRIKVVQAINADMTLIIVPRYQVFSDIAVELSRKGRRIIEIAGNHNILMTAILRNGALPAAGLAELFSMPLDARPGWRRAGFDVKIEDLPGIVAELDRSQVMIEHLFDY